MKLLRLLVSFLLLSCAIVTPQSSRNFGFVSPNTRDDLKLEDAIQGMDSQEERILLSRARNLGCVIKRTVSTMPAVGSWSDGAEHSILIRVNADESTIRYLMSRLGIDANQKAVVYFHPQAKGRARIYIIQPSNRFRSFRQIGGVLDKSGIAFRTLVPTRSRVIVYVIDIENTMRRKVNDAAKRLRGRVISQTGNADFIGDDSRDMGQAVFAEEMKQYERKHPRLPPPCEVYQ
jgi:hypothetical protein